MSFYPSLEGALEAAKLDKRRLFSVTRSYRSLLPLVLLSLISVFAVYGIILSSLNSGSEGASTLRWLGIFPALFIAETFRRKYNDIWIFGLESLTHHKGRLSLTYTVPVINYSDIRAINVNQDFWGRILNHGSVLIGTAGHNDYELVLSGVIPPQLLTDLIEKLRRLSLKSSPGNEGARSGE